jgi:GNAT superfamily N-acetyltransferase
MISIRPAWPEEASFLTELCLRSKAVWGYDEAFMAACRGELTLTPEMITTGEVAVAEIEGQVVGMVQLDLGRVVGELSKLFVEPTCLKSGTGRALFDWAKDRARQLGATMLVIDADPGAADFYRHLGALDAGIVPSGSIPGRYIPRLELQLR